MSPHDSQPRRRLPTGSNSRAGRLRPAGTRPAPRRRRRACRAAGAGRVLRCRSSMAFRISASFFGAHALAARAPGRRCGGLPSSSSVLIAELAVEHARRSSARRPGGAADRGSSAETPRAAPGDSGASPVSAISRIRAARSLPMPGISRSCRRRRACASSCGWFADDVGAVAVRANLERVLALDLEQVGDLAEHPRDRDVIQRGALALDPVVEQPRAAGGQRLGDGWSRLGRAVAEEASAAAGAADLRRGGAGRLRPRDQRLDGRRGDARRQPLAVVPFDRRFAGRPRPSRRARARRASPRPCRECARSSRRRAGRRRCAAW